MVARVRVTLNHAGVQEMLCGEGLAAHLRERGDRVLQAAQSGAPVRSGEYRDQIEVTSDVQERYGSPRTVVSVVASAPHSLLVESRTGNLAKALDAAGE